MSRVPGSRRQEPRQPTLITECPYIAEHRVPNDGSFIDGREYTTIPRFHVGGTGTWDGLTPPEVTYRCVLGHEWNPLAASDLIR